MAFKRTVPFENSENYDFDDEKIEIISLLSLARLIPQVSGAEATMYAKLDENKGLVAIDSSGNGIHGAFQGGLDETNWTTGKINSAIVGISTTSGFINFDQLIEYERTDAFSLECWFNTTSTAAMSFISKQKFTGVLEGFAISCTGGKPRAVIRDTSSNVISIEAENAYNDGDWHHVVLTYDGSSNASGTKLYCAWS